MLHIKTFTVSANLTNIFVHIIAFISHNLFDHNFIYKYLFTYQLNLKLFLKIFIIKIFS